jgi:cytochrome c-type biogenesis protein CcmH
VADQIKAEIQKKIDSGMTESQIVDSFVAEYGQTVLSAPPKAGFNLTAWLLPFLAFLIGGAVLFAFLKNQNKNKSLTTTAVPLKPNEDEDSYRIRVLKELENRK